LINGLQINPESELTAIAIVKAAMAQGLLVAPAGAKVLRFVPPLIISEAEIEAGMEKLKTAIDAIKS